MSQRHSHSWFESISNTVVGFGLAIATQVFTFPLFGLDVDLGTNFLIAIPFTVVSVVRGYLLRRFWNWVHLAMEDIDNAF